MFEQRKKTAQPPICDLVPGYGYYNHMADGLAESLLNAVEWVIDFLNSPRTR